MLFTWMTLPGLLTFCTCNDEDIKKNSWLCVMSIFKKSINYSPLSFTHRKRDRKNCMGEGIQDRPLTVEGSEFNLAPYP